jgi:hypothetical protein
MRNAFARTIEEFAKQDDGLVLLSGDIGNRMFDTYKAAWAGSILQLRRGGGEYDKRCSGFGHDRIAAVGLYDRFVFGIQTL